jgi:hypothetical protein
MVATPSMVIVGTVIRVVVAAGWNHDTAGQRGEQKAGNQQSGTKAHFGYSLSGRKQLGPMPRPKRRQRSGSNLLFRLGTLALVSAAGGGSGEGVLLSLRQANMQGAKAELKAAVAGTGVC